MASKAITNNNKLLLTTLLYGQPIYNIPLVYKTRWHTLLDQYNNYNTYISSRRCITTKQKQCKSNTSSLYQYKQHNNYNAAYKDNININNQHSHARYTCTNTRLHRLSQRKPSHQIAHLSTVTADKSSSNHDTTKQTINNLTRAYKRSMTPNMVRDNKWLVLSKIRIGVWNMIAASLSYMTMPNGTLIGLILTSIGTLSYASSSLAWNQLAEKDYDKNMVRTRNRPLIKNTITEQQAKLFIGSTLCIGAITTYTAGGYVASLVGLATVLGYVYVYTPLKRRTQYNTEVGALVGAMPILLGCVASEGITALYMILTWIQYMIMVAWQIPHFYTIAWRQRVDYALAGFKMISLNDTNNGYNTTRAGIKWIVLLWLLPFVLDYFGYTTEMFIVSSILLNTLFTASYIMFICNASKYAATCQYVSYVHIIGLLASLNIFSLGKPEWFTFKGIRKAGYTYCIHPILMSMGLKIDDLPEWMCTHLTQDVKQTKIQVKAIVDNCDDTHDDVNVNSTTQSHQQQDTATSTDKHIKKAIAHPSTH